MARLHNLTIKPRRMPKTRKEKHLSIGEYVIVNCAKCDTELAMTIPFDGLPVLCADHDRPVHQLEVGEDVIAFEDVP